MLFEHFALNVSEPTSMALWYKEHLNMQIVSKMERAPYTHFLADETGRVVMEIYSNRTDPVPDYSAQHPFRFHFAFAVTDAAAKKDRLLEAGASFFEELYLDDGSYLVMLRDPWGIPLQLCQRKIPLGQIRKEPTMS